MIDIELLKQLEKLGFDSWFLDQAKSENLQAFFPARVITVNKDNVVIRNGQKDIRAELSGKLMFSIDSSLDMPAVGDWVAVQYFDDETFAIIHTVFPRKTILKRKTSGKKIDFQLIAANIDTSLLMQSLDANFNPNRLERYLVMAADGGLDSVILLSKYDLLSQKEIKEKEDEIRHHMPDVPVVIFSNHIENDYLKVSQMLESGKTYCLLGSSGVGKTTLLNHLLGADLYRTQSVREQDGKGRHTTSRRELMMLENGAMIVDTPGMRELGNFDIETSLSETFDEISELATGCKYKDCTHIQETGCAVLKAVEEGMISEQRYQNYIKMWKESQYLNRSYLDKRRKDKAFGKMVKVMKKSGLNKKMIG